MAEFAAAPPNTHAGGNDDALRVKELPYHEAAPGGEQPFDMEAYQRTTPLWKRVMLHSLTQMILLSVQGFCGPAMDDALNGLGAGGLATTQTANICNSILYVCMAITCAFGGPLVNLIGTKWALVLGACAFPFDGSSLYVNSKTGNQWYMIFAAPLMGFASGAWYVAEAGSILSLAPSGARGKYLALWIVSRNLGQLIGGAINLSKNHTAGVNGGVAYTTYIPFIIIECMALPFALFISPLEHVVRSDGTKIVVSDKLSIKQEFRYLGTTYSSRLVLLAAPWAFWSFFYSGTWGTYLTLYFSTRARALSSLISPFFCIVGCFGLGFILDIKGLSQRRRAQIGFLTVILLNLGVYIWSIVVQVDFRHNDPGAIDWSDSNYARSFLPYFFVQTTGPLSQSYMYWLLSSFATDARANVRNGAAFRAIEAIGQCVAYGMNTKTTADPLIGMCVTFALLGVIIVPTLFLVNDTPDRIPADVIAEETQQVQLEGESKGEK